MEILLDVFGRELLVSRRGDSWEACYVGAEGKKRLASDITIPGATRCEDIPRYIADLCHEWATPIHREVKIIRSSTNGKT